MIPDTTPRGWGALVPQRRNYWIISTTKISCQPMYLLDQ